MHRRAPPRWAGYNDSPMAVMLPETADERILDIRRLVPVLALFCVALVSPASAQQVFVDSLWVHDAGSTGLGVGCVSSTTYTTCSDGSGNRPLGPNGGNISNAPNIQFTQYDAGQISGCTGSAFPAGVVSRNICNSQINFCAKIGFSNTQSGNAPFALESVSFEIFRFAQGSNPLDSNSTPPLRTFIINNPGQIPAGQDSASNPTSGPPPICVTWDGSINIQGESGKSNGQYGFRGTVVTNQAGSSGNITITQTRAFPGGFTRDSDGTSVDEKPLTMDVTDLHVVRASPTVVGNITGVAAEPFNITYRLSKDATMYLSIEKLQSNQSTATVRALVLAAPRAGEGVPSGTLQNGDSWNGRFDNGDLAPPGSYLINLHAVSSDQWGTDLTTSVVRGIEVDPLQITDIRGQSLTNIATSPASLSFMLTEPATVYIDIYPPGTTFSNGLVGLNSMTDEDPASVRGVRGVQKDFGPSNLPLRHFEAFRGARSETSNSWDGRDANGEIVADGDYVFVVYAALQSQNGFAFRGNASDKRIWSTAARTGILSVSTTRPSIAAPPIVLVGSTSVSVQWASGGNAPGTLYICQASTDGFQTISRTSTTTNLGAGFGLGGEGPVLETNRSYAFRVRAEGSTFVPLGSTRTLAAVPGLPTFSSISTTSLRVDWPSGGNPSNVLYTAMLSSGDAPNTNGFSGNSSSITFNGFAIFSGLRRNTTYFVMVRASNSDGLPSSFSGQSSAPTTGLYAPSIFASEAAISSITWRWGDVVGATGFRLVSSSDGDVSGGLAAGTTVWVETSLVPNTLYSRRVVAFAPDDVSTSPARALYTLAARPISLRFDFVGVSSFSASWDANNNPPSTTFSVRISTPGGTPASNTASTTSYIFLGLTPNATYELSLSAINLDGVETPSGLNISTRTLAATVDAVPPGQNKTIVFDPPTGTVLIDIPPDTFRESVEFTVRTPAVLPSGSATDGSLIGIGVGVEVTTDKGLQPTQAVDISIGYRDADVIGLDANRLVLARYDPSRGVWIPLLSSVDVSARRVRAKTRHFSIFQVMQSNPSDTVSTVRVVPNPFRPSRGQVAMGFFNLPPTARVRIYTLAGEIVRDITGNAAGLAVWDGKNDAGMNAASGVYYALIQGKGGNKTVTVALER